MKGVHDVINGSHIIIMLNWKGAINLIAVENEVALTEEAGCRGGEGRRKLSRKGIPSTRRRELGR